MPSYQREKHITEFGHALPSGKNPVTTHCFFPIARDFHEEGSVLCQVNKGQQAHKVYLYCSCYLVSVPEYKDSTADAAG